MSSIFPHELTELAGITSRLLDAARQHGATDASASVFESKAQAVQLRQGRIQSLGREVRNGLSLTVFIGQRQGSAHSSDLAPASLAEMAEAACAIARHTEEDPYAGLPEPGEFARHLEDLDLYHPWEPDSETLITLAREIENGMAACPEAASDGAWANAGQSQFWLANTRGFGAGYAHSGHSLSARVLAQRGDSRNRDFWFCQARRQAHLENAASIGAEAARRTVAALNPKRIQGGNFPVLFDPRSACTLLGHFSQAVSGRPLYMKTSFLGERFDSQILPVHISILEDPFIPGGKASAPFDADGIAGSRRALVDAGWLRSPLLGHYAARRLGQHSTGNAGGAYNLSMTSTLTRPEDNFASMLEKLGTGLLVTSLAGDGLRLINGDYSRVAQGFWVENGSIAHPVDGATIAGNLLEMWQQIVAIGKDIQTEGPFTTGSILIGNMRIAGQ
jgi:PmbA protein